MITPDLMKKFLDFLTKAIDFDIRIVDDEDSINQLVDFFIDISAEEESDADILDWLFAFDRITWSTIWLSRKEYNKIIATWYGREFIKQNQFITNIVTGDKKQMIIMEFIRVKQKGSHKTLEELQNELEMALNQENYKDAAKIQQSIKNRTKTKIKQRKNESESNSKK